MAGWPVAYRKPPSAGPAITAVVKTDELYASACGSFSPGTRKGSSEEPDGAAKPRAAPNSTSTA